MLSTDGGLCVYHTTDKELHRISLNGRKDDAIRPHVKAIHVSLECEYNTRSGIKVIYITQQNMIYKRYTC